MIGVIATEAEHSLVREFFELFKTPWEFYRAGRPYEVLICSGDTFQKSEAKLVLVYGSGEKPFDRESKTQIHSQRHNAVLRLGENRIPIYGECAAFNSGGVHVLTDENTQAAVALRFKSGNQTFVRIGFDLFPEIRHLLTCGQPPTHAQIPTLELHVAFLRDLIVNCSIPLVEIPPVPVGHGFMACLTHDVDHAGIRSHKCDHTIVGFLYRAIIGSMIQVCRGRMSVEQLGVNWLAVFRLPFVYLGLAKDFWRQWDRYSQIEEGLGSTFFVIPFKDNPGQGVNNPKAARRATRYDIGDIADEIRKLRSAGSEIGLHGIDAWLDSARGRVERERIARETGASEVGVRMHWLCYDEKSPLALEAAGFSYDSTSGYNECVGYRAGTVQAFGPMGTMRLLELPMHVMDTALFYPSRMNLSPAAAEGVVNGLVENASRFGGVLTINWHDRSIAPERLWDDIYVKLLQELKRRGAWFPTAGRAVAWFRKRRSAVIENVAWEGKALRVKASVDSGADNLPGLIIRIHRPRAVQTDGARQTDPAGGFVDIAFNGVMDECVALQN